MILEPPASDAARLALARELRAAGRSAEAVPLLAAVLAAQPANSVVAHNLAAAQGDSGDHEGAAISARRAIALKSRPETWLVLGRALQSGGDFSEARRAFDEAVSARPDYIEALRDLSQLIWMTTGDADDAVEPLLRAAKRTPSADLLAMTCGVLRDTRGRHVAAEFIRPYAGKGAAAIELAAASVADPGGDAHLWHAQAALRLAPDNRESRRAWITALLGHRRFDEALAEIRAWLASSPDDPEPLNLRRAAHRFLSLAPDRDHREAAALVEVTDLPTPEIWPSREAWVDALGSALLDLHAFSAPPFGQSIRDGVQTRTDPRHAPAPAIRATFDRIEAQLAIYARSGAAGAASAASIIGAWSVKFDGRGGHNDHIHPVGWISSVFYVETVEAAGAKAGWLRFGAADFGPRATLPPELWIEPKPGRLVLFPSYLSHGTEPFERGRRLSMAFDAVRAQG